MNGLGQTPKVQHRDPQGKQLIKTGGSSAGPASQQPWLRTPDPGPCQRGPTGIVPAWAGRGLARRGQQELSLFPSSQEAACEARSVPPVMCKEEPACLTLTLPPGLVGLFSSSLFYSPPRKDAACKARILDPSSDSYSRWLNVMVAPIMYNWIILICRSCFPDLQQKYLLLWLTLDYLCDLLYLVDIGVHFHTGPNHRILHRRDQAASTSSSPTQSDTAPQGFVPERSPQSCFLGTGQARNPAPGVLFPPGCLALRCCHRRLSFAALSKRAPGFIR
uniref:Uncharacterized protein n=1 Tax=Sphaerodactylus townsendi TaxID=933632 RepID=A0ACB8FFQ9_9SAUR